MLRIEIKIRIIEHIPMLNQWIQVMTDYLLQIAILGVYRFGALDVWAFDRRGRVSMVKYMVAIEYNDLWFEFWHTGRGVDLLLVMGDHLEVILPVLGA